MLHTAPVTLTSELPGRVSALETSDVRPQINGIIRRRDFVEGSIVQAGQVLYEIEDAPYRAALLNAQGQLAQAEANIRSTQLQADRYRQLVTINGVSKQDADNAEAAAAQAKAAVTAQRGALQRRRGQPGLHPHPRADLRPDRPLAVTTGALVQTGQTDALATIQRIDQVYVDITQSAADLLNLRAAMAAAARRRRRRAQVQLILPNGSVYPIDGQLRFADVTVDPTTGAVTLRAIFPNPNGVLLPGMYVRARLIEGRAASTALLAPQAGVTPRRAGPGDRLVVGPGNVVAQRVAQDRPGGRRQVAGHRRPAAGRPADRRRPAQPAIPAPRSRRVPPRRKLGRPCRASSSTGRSSRG